MYTCECEYVCERVSGFNLFFLEATTRGLRNLDCIANFRSIFIANQRWEHTNSICTNLLNQIQAGLCVYMDICIKLTSDHCHYRCYEIAMWKKIAIWNHDDGLPRTSVNCDRFNGCFHSKCLRRWRRSRSRVYACITWE